MTTNDTKALVAELREIRATMRENTNLLRLLVKQVEKGQAKSQEVEDMTTSDRFDDLDQAEQIRRLQYAIVVLTNWIPDFGVKHAENIANLIEYGTTERPPDA